MTTDIFESVEALQSAVEYFDQNGSVIDAISALEMTAFLENTFKGRKVEIRANYSKEAGYHFTIDRPNAGYIVINPVSGQWHNNNYIEQFVMRIRLCKLNCEPYQWVNDQNRRNHDIKLILEHDSDGLFLEARRHFDLYGGINSDNLCKTIEDFTISAQLLAQVTQKDLIQANKKSTAHDYQSPSAQVRH